VSRNQLQVGFLRNKLPLERTRQLAAVSNENCF